MFDVFMITTYIDYDKKKANECNKDTI